MQLNLVHLYPKLLNTYGDNGNIKALIYRAQKRGIKINLIPITPQDSLKPGSFDLLFSGGGQDQQQLIVSKDLQIKKQTLIKAANLGIPMLTICGSYQLFGHYFKTSNQQKIPGIGLLDTYTKASKTRKIGNVIIKTNFLTPNTLVGFENHSGNTYLNSSSSTKPLGIVTQGFGNNGQDKTAGAVYQHVYGCYLHGSLLPKNPHFTDHLLKLALKRKYKLSKLKPLNDDLEWQTHHSVIKYIKTPGWWNW